MGNHEEDEKLQRAAPPPPAKSKQPLHCFNSSQETMQDKKRMSKPPPSWWYKHSKQPESPKVDTPIDQPTRRSFIWPWLEGKLEKQHERSGPILVPMQVSDDSTSIPKRVTDFETYAHQWNITGAPPPVPESKANMEANSIEGLQQSGSMENVTHNNKEEENVLHTIEQKKEKLPEEEEENRADDDVQEEKDKEELQACFDKSKINKPQDTEPLRIGAFELLVKKKEKTNANPTGPVPLASAMVGDENINEKADRVSKGCARWPREQ